MAILFFSSACWKPPIYPTHNPNFILVLFLKFCHKYCNILHCLLQSHSIISDVGARTWQFMQGLKILGLCFTIVIFFTFYLQSMNTWNWFIGRSLLLPTSMRQGVILIFCISIIVSTLVCIMGREKFCSI